MFCHTVTIWERVVKYRLRREVRISDEQFGFMPGRNTVGAVLALRIVNGEAQTRAGVARCVCRLERVYGRVP